MRTPSRSFVAVTALAALACAAPVQGEPCSPGDRLASVEEGPVCSGPGWCWLTCSGPPGCDGPVDFRWQAPVNRPTEWCGCDRRTHAGEIDEFEDAYFELPTTRWLHFGSCEDPCADVHFVTGFDDRWTNYVGIGLPYDSVLPRCTVCVGASPMETAPGETRCIGADGEPVSDDCCEYCADATLDADGMCTTPMGGTLPEPCCRPVG